VKKKTGRGEYFWSHDYFVELIGIYDGGSFMCLGLSNLLLVFTSCCGNGFSAILFMISVHIAQRKWLCAVLCPSLELMSGIMWPYSCQKCLEQLKQEFALVKSKLEHMFEVILLT
jgi:hypothetical protein